jgi:hypothetical protein
MAPIRARAKARLSELRKRVRNGAQPAARSALYVPRPQWMRGPDAQAPAASLRTAAAQEGAVTTPMSCRVVAAVGHRRAVSLVR